MSQQDIDRYLRAMHAVQSGVAMEMQDGSPDTQPKHLRVGVNSALVNDEAVARLLMEKGVFTRDEYDKAVADAAEREAGRYEERLSLAHGVKVTLS